MTWNSGADPNGFNGQEKDNEIYGAGNLTTAEYWEYDTRLGRRWNIDPKHEPAKSPYSVFSGNPIIYIDTNGDDDYYSKAGTYLGQVGTGTAVRIIDKPQYEDAVKNQASPADFEAASHVLQIQDAGQGQYLKGIADATNYNCNEQGAYVVLDLSDEKNPILRYEKNNSASDDISISHKVASGKISAEDVKYPVGSNGKADKSLVIVGEVHGHSETDSQGRPIKSGVSQQTNASGGNDVNVASNLKVPVYAVDQKNIHKVDQKGKVDNNKSKDTNVLKDALETKGGKPSTP